MSGRRTRYYECDPNVPSGLREIFPPESPPRTPPSALSPIRVIDLISESDDSSSLEMTIPPLPSPRPFSPLEPSPSPPRQRLSSSGPPSPLASRSTWAQTPPYTPANVKRGRRRSPYSSPSSSSSRSYSSSSPHSSGSSFGSPSTEATEEEEYEPAPVEQGVYSRYVPEDILRLSVDVQDAMAASHGREMYGELSPGTVKSIFDWLRPINRVLGPVHGFLDIGCGPGHLPAYAVATGFAIHGYGVEVVSDWERVARQFQRQLSLHDFDAVRSIRLFFGPEEGDIRQVAQRAPSWINDVQFVYAFDARFPTDSGIYEMMADMFNRSPSMQWIALFRDEAFVTAKGFDAELIATFQINDVQQGFTGKDFKLHLYGKTGMSINKLIPIESVPKKRPGKKKKRRIGAKCRSCGIRPPVLRCSDCDDAICAHPACRLVAFH